MATLTKTLTQTTSIFHNIIKVRQKGTVSRIQSPLQRVGREFHVRNKKSVKKGNVVRTEPLSLNLIVCLPLI